MKELAVPQLVEVGEQAAENCHYASPPRFPSKDRTLLYTS